MDELTKAIMDHGSRPDYHRDAMRDLRKYWPTLADALCNHVRNTGLNPPVQLSHG